MNCFCCGKPLRSVSVSGWHPSCIRRFFGTKVLPELELNDEVLSLLAEKNVSRGFTVPGVQKKLSLHLSQEKEIRLTLVDYPSGFILKPQVEEFRALPESEYLVMQMAKIGGLSVVPHALLTVNGSFAYITKRIDRIIIPSHAPQQLAMEDFCQLSLRLTQDKYKGSYEQCVRVIRQYSGQPGLDISELFLRLVFCFLTGNSDMHLKNFSLIETAPESGSFLLSPAYDLLPVNIIMPEDSEEFALQLSGKKRLLSQKHFISFAEYAGIPHHAALSMIRQMLRKIPTWEKMCQESLLPPDLKTALSDLMLSRAGCLEA